MRLRSRNRTRSMAWSGFRNFGSDMPGGNEVQVDRCAQPLFSGMGRNSVAFIAANSAAFTPMTSASVPMLEKGISGAAGQRANRLTELEHAVSLEWRPSRDLSHIPHHDDEATFMHERRVGSSRGASPRLGCGANERSE